LDALYDKAAGAAAGGKGTDRKRQLDASSSEAQQEQQGPEHKRQRQQEQQMQADAGTLQDTEMADAAAAAAADDPAEAGVSAAAEAAAGEGAAAAHGGRKEGRVHHVVKSEDLDQLIAGGFNSLIVAAPKLQPAAILQQLLPLMAPSSPFVVFSPWVQPLAEAMSALTASRSAVLLQLQESWLRPYQVLPGRTHPHMALTTGGTGGYILSGITVAASSRSEAAVDEQKGGSGRGRGQRGRGRGGRRR
jgi:tRNA (adenine-N(1)-)-methyltransferase non-catalytic subunit